VRAAVAACVTGVEVADRVAGELAARADPAQAEPMAAYMRDQFPFLGVKAPAQARAWTAATAGLPRRLPEDVVVAAALDLWGRPEREHQYLACRLVNRHAAAPRTAAVPPSRAFLDVIERLVVTRSWWDTVDALAIHATGDLVRRYPDLRPRMDAWLAGEDLWLVRSALLHMNRWGAARDADWLFAACLARADHPDFFVRKAIGWVLREHSKLDGPAVASFVAAHVGELSGLSRREALAWLDRRR
jgi:3-methyladenine DNA glycosylase AlkD